MNGASPLPRHRRFPRYAAAPWPGFLARMALAGWLCVVAHGVHAQEPPTAASPAAPAASRPALPPFVAPEVRLQGLPLLQALRAGGFILFMRHAFAGPPTPACPEEAVLTEEGRAQARAVGAALRQLKVPVAQLQSSDTCRTRETASLLGLGPVATNHDLDPAARRRPVPAYAEQFRYLMQVPPPGGNLLLVSHVQGSDVVEERILIDLAEIVVYRWPGSGKAIPVARIPLQAWPMLAAADKS